MSSPFRIVIGFTSQRRWTRYMFQGISRYAREAGNWEFEFPGHSFQVYSGKPGLRVHGIIGDHPEHLPGGLPPKLPGVWLQDSSTPRVTMNHEAMGRMACQHLLDRGYQHLAAFNTADYSKTGHHLRIGAFNQLAREAGLQPSLFDVGPRTHKRKKWMLEDQVLDFADFLKSLPRPLGLVCCDVDHTQRALSVCQRFGYRIPDDIAIISATDDEMIFPYLQPAITAVVHDQEQIGYQAAKLLDLILRGEDHPEVIQISPKMVAVRGSTDRRAVEDPFCEKVVHYMWDHVGEELSVQSLADLFNVSERTLVRRFKQKLGHSPIKEIQSARLEAAKKLLLTSHLSLADIAHQTGFSGQPHFQREFKKATGMTPGQMRKAHGISQPRRPDGAT